MLKDFPDLLKNKGGYLLRGGYLLAIGLMLWQAG